MRFHRNMVIKLKIISENKLSDKGLDCSCTIIRISMDLPVALHMYEYPTILLNFNFLYFKLELQSFCKIYSVFKLFYSLITFQVGV